MKRSGFTMIELVFVIVILGILASVAIPKLAATRDDAKIASKAQEIQTAIAEIPAYVTAQGDTSVPLTTMSQVLNQLVKQGTDKATLANGADGTAGHKVTIKTQNGTSSEAVFDIEVNATTLQLSKSAAASGVIGKALQARIQEGNFTIGGTSLKF